MASKRGRLSGGDLDKKIKLDDFLNNYEVSHVSDRLDNIPYDNEYAENIIFSILYDEKFKNKHTGETITVTRVEKKTRENIINLIYKNVEPDINITYQEFLTNYVSDEMREWLHNNDSDDTILARVLRSVEYFTKTGTGGNVRITVRRVGRYDDNSRYVAIENVNSRYSGGKRRKTKRKTKRKIQRKKTTYRRRKSKL